MGKCRMLAMDSIWELRPLEIVGAESLYSLSCPAHRIVGGPLQFYGEFNSLRMHEHCH